MYQFLDHQNVFENNGKKRKKHRKIALLVRSNLNSIEKIISKAVADSNISDKKFTLVINEKQNYFWLKESIRAIDYRPSGIKCDKLIEYDKMI